MKLPALFVVLAGLAVACGAEVGAVDPNAGGAGTGSSSTGGDRSSSSSPSSSANGGNGDGICSNAAPACSPARHVGSASDLVAEAAKLSWQRVSISKVGVLQLGDDLIADADIEVDASALTASPDCSDETQCRAPLFRTYSFPSWAGPGIEGVTCAVIGDHPVRKGDTCARVVVAKGTTFRLRAVVEDMHPSSPNYWSFVDFADACTKPCADDEVRCAATQTCFTKGYASCAYCEGNSAQVCTCRLGCGTQPDGETCSYDSSPDVVQTGTCQSGSCQRN
jgi:hypothetical protein